MYKVMLEAHFELNTQKQNFIAVFSGQPKMKE